MHGNALSVLTSLCSYIQPPFLLSKELSPTNDANLVKSLMNLMDSLLDEFHDEATFKELNEREVAAWLEVVSFSLIV